MSATNKYKGFSFHGMGPSGVVGEHLDQMLTDMLSYGASEALQIEAARLLQRIMRMRLPGSQLEDLFFELETCEPEQPAVSSRPPWVPEDPAELVVAWRGLPPNMRIGAKAETVCGVSPGESLALRLGSFFVDPADGQAYMKIDRIRTKGVTRLGQEPTIVKVTKREERDRVIPVAKLFFAAVEEHRDQYFPEYDFSDPDHPDRDKWLLLQRPEKVGGDYPAATATSRDSAYKTASTIYAKQVLESGGEEPEGLSPYTGRHNFATITAREHAHLGHLLAPYQGHAPDSGVGARGSRGRAAPVTGFIDLEEYLGKKPATAMTGMELRHYVHLYGRALLPMAEAMDESWSKPGRSLIDPSDQEIVPGTEWLNQSQAKKTLGAARFQELVGRGELRPERRWAWRATQSRDFFRRADVDGLAAEVAA